MIEIEVENFQSIENVKINVEGFAALTGRSSIGKSALIRAVQFALSNEMGTTFVRHSKTCTRKTKGSKTCKCYSTVRIKMDGFDLKWEKGDAVNRYTFNGEEYDKPDRGVPDFLVRAGFGPLSVGDEKTCIQVSDQFDPLFLINKSGPVVAETISDVGRLDRINTAMRAAERDRKDASSTRKIREKDLESLKDRLIPYSRLDQDVQKVKSVQSQLSNLKTHRGNVSRMTHFQTSLGLTLQKIQSLADITAAVQIPGFDLRSKLGELLKLDRLVETLASKATQFKSMLWVEALPDLPSESFQASIRLFEQINSWYSKLKNIKDRYLVIEKVDTIPIPDLDQLKKKLASLFVIDRLYRQYQQTSVSLTVYEGAETIPQTEFPSRISELLANISYLDQVSRKIQTLTTSIEKLNSEYTKTTKEQESVQKEIDTFGVCPTCVQPLRNIAEEGHRHLAEVGT